MRRSERPGLALLALVGLIVCSAGCDKATRSFAVNTPPTLTMTSGPIDTVSTPLSWIVTIAWSALDPDGLVDHYEYAIDPPSLKHATMASAETTWVSTRERGATIHFRASRADSLGPGATASEFHVFVLRAVDDRGGVSPRLARAFYAYTVAPDLQIVSPRPSALLRAQVPAPFRLSWTGDDPDGAGSRAAAFYRVRLLSLDAPGTWAFLADPDSLRRIAVATDWADWRTVGGDTTSLVLEDATLVAGTNWLLAAVAVDEAGASTAYMNLNRNMLQFTVDYMSGPRVHVHSPYIDYLSAPNSLEYVPVTALADRILTFHWEGIPSPGRTILGTRWMLDGNINDESPRSDESTDWSHWSRLVPGPGSAAFGPLTAGGHYLYIQAKDDFGGQTLLGLQIDCVDAPLDRDLLVVDDTRLEADKFPGGVLALYTQPWPSAAELDTFLYARGGVPWRGARNPAGALSTPGLLAGFSFDTLGTRLGYEDPASAVPLSTLLRYRRVLWLVDGRSALNLKSQDQQIFPVTALRAMSEPGHSNALAVYVNAGGQVWLAGGGAAFASLAEYDRAQNNIAQTTVFRSEPTAPELGPGHPLYDFGHIRSAIAVTRTAAVLNSRSQAARGGWSAHGPDGTLGAPDYSRLPAVLRLRDPATDPIPPTRAASQGGLYYLTTIGLEYVLDPNSIVEDMDPDPGVARMESTLDTLVEATGAVLLTSPAPAMTYYHGRDNAPFVFTGHDLWSWTRADAQALVDFVLADIWGMSRTGPRAANTYTSTGSAGGPPAGKRASPSRRLDPPRARP